MKGDGQKGKYRIQKVKSTPQEKAQNLGSISPRARAKNK